MHKSPLFKDLTGLSFGYLTVLHLNEEKSRHKNYYWLCQCVCGKTRSLQTSQLTCGKVTSCGCQNPRKKRGDLIALDRRMYTIYSGMLARCYNPNSISYNYYGAKSIHVCDEWRASFAAFREWAHSNGYTDELSIDRIDNSKGYEPSNCRWVPLNEQCKNKTSNIFLTHNGETHIMADWCDILGFSRDLAKSRVKLAKRYGIEITFDYVFAPKHNRGQKLIT